MFKFYFDSHFISFMKYFYNNEFPFFDDCFKSHCILINFSSNYEFHYYILNIIQIMRVCLSYFIVEKIRDGMSPQRACEEAIKRLLELKVRDPYDLIFSTN